MPRVVGAKYGRSGSGGTNGEGEGGAEKGLRGEIVPRCLSAGGFNARADGRLSWRAKRGGRLLTSPPSAAACFPGLEYSNRRALAAGCGCTGPPSISSRSAGRGPDRGAGRGTGVARTSSEDVLAARVLEQEHLAAAPPAAVRWILGAACAQGDPLLAEEHRPAGPLGVCALIG